MVFLQAHSSPALHWHHNAGGFRDCHSCVSKCTYTPVYISCVPESHKWHTWLEFDPHSSSKITTVLEKMPPWIRDLKAAAAPSLGRMSCAPLPSRKSQQQQPGAMDEWAPREGLTGTPVPALCPGRTHSQGNKSSGAASLWLLWRWTDGTPKQGSWSKGSEHRPWY